jgi:hypothetical protein
MKIKKYRPEILALMEKVRGQLLELQKPVRRTVVIKRFKTAKRNRRLQVLPTVEDYRRMDPCWMSTMSGAFAGRVIKRGKVGL